MVAFEFAHKVLRPDLKDAVNDHKARANALLHEFYEFLEKENPT